MGEKLAGVILSGGGSTRFGEPKAFAKMNGKAFYQHAADALSPFTEEILIVSHPDLKQRFEGETSYPVIQDQEPYAEKGPLSGIYAAMEQCDAQWYFIVACDMPYFNSDAAGKLLHHRSKEVQGVIPSSEGRMQPLAAIYHKDTLPHLKNQLSSGSFRMMEWIERFHVKVVTEDVSGIDKSAFQNINDQKTFVLLKTINDKA
ncbi:molybdenum cofactor guanylyltransferase [Jeotgalibacillus campisalis]|uniref:Probable molybdenum cofactor guanylyltransferase n=1 Tax=Jeotgalibacillus campisalis TaxID=220754 RepID=A0A0C2VYU8_9BACL|nr:molybdenum cofactor guanylyltransferase [Jeotgalibacillus campisalis]KIL49123.1 hypothetical protein KR50_11580 [Jeotgalibacillus campisalis]